MARLTRARFAKRSTTAQRRLTTKGSGRTVILTHAAAARRRLWAATSLPRYLATSLPRYLATSLPRYLATSLPRYLATSLPRYLAASRAVLLTVPPCRH